MSFVHPGWLAAGVAACLVLAWAWWALDRRQEAALARFVSPHLRVELTRSISTARRRMQRGLYGLAVALLFVALAEPLLGFRWEQVSRRGNEIIFAIDTSRSMSTPDIRPNRLARAKLAIDDFVNRLDGDAVGIVAFAGSAFLVCPMTLDYGAFHETMTAIDTNTIPRGGTNISSAIREAQTALRRRGGADKILILVTDGEDLEGGAVAAARSAKQEDGLTVYTVGVGTASGDLIPMPQDQGGGFVKDEAGQFVKSRLDATTLDGIAKATGGFYVPLGTQGEGLETIYDKVLGPLAKHDLAFRQQKVYTERFQWPLAGSLGMLLASLIVGTRRRAAVRPPMAAPARAPGLARGGAAAALGLTVLAGGAGGNVRADTLSAAQAYRKGDYAAAESAYAAAAQHDPNAPALQYNLGAAAYKAGRYPQAAQAFQQSIAKAPSSDPKRLADQEDAYYDLGNSLFRAGQKTEQTAPQDTLKQWNDAVKAYETALQLRPDDADSKYNRDLVKRRIEALKQQQNQNPKQNQDKNQQGQGQNPQQSPQQGEGQGQGQSQDKPPNPPTSPQNAGNPPQKPGEQPPPKPGQGGAPPGDTRPNAGQPPPASATNQPQGRNAAGGNPDQQADADSREADQQHPPGQMSREEARELLDSVKGDERHAPAVPVAQRESEAEQQQPAKNW